MATKCGLVTTESTQSREALRFAGERLVPTLWKPQWLFCCRDYKRVWLLYKRYWRQNVNDKNDEFKASLLAAMQRLDPELDAKREVYNLELLVELRRRLTWERFGQALVNMGFDCDRFYEEPWDSLERINALPKDEVKE
jgi:hypothetical protein